MILGILSASAAFAGIIIDPAESCRAERDRPDENRRSGTKLVVKPSKKSWIKFDLGALDVAHLETATLMVAAIDDESGNSCHLSVVNDSYTTGIDWTSDDLTWNNAPANDTLSDTALTTDATLVANFVVDGSAGTLFAIDILAALQADTDGTVQFVLHNSTGGQISFATHDHPEAAWRPFIEATEGTWGQARNPYPANRDTDVPRDVVLEWTLGESVAPMDGHKVYFGESFNDVNDGLGGITLSAASYALPQQLDFETTYYWRVDEVNGPPDFTVYEGKVWSFTTEPVAYVIQNITATASSSDPSKGHSNGSLEPAIGLGFKDVSVEYSVNGTDYTTLGTTHEFARAPGAPDYAHNTIVDLSGVSAKYLRLTANSNWGGLLNQYGLSEVRFFYIPVWAREPDPDSGATNVDLDVLLSWGAGREAVTHDVFLSTDEQAVIDGNTPVAAVTEAGYGPLDLDLGTTYYWRVDEVNEAETPATWQGTVWNFTTRELLIVEDFESYNDIPAGEEGSNLIYLTWTDGFDNPSNGSTIGYVEPFQPTMETNIVHGGVQSVPLTYDNSAASFSEVTVNPADLPIGRDWTIGSPQTLMLYFYGTEGNTGQLYVKINGSKVVYDGDAGDIAKAEWKQWNIDLASLGAGVQNVTKLSIGIDGNGASGTLYIDDIRLYRQAPQPEAP